MKFAHYISSTLMTAFINFPYQSPRKTKAINFHIFQLTTDIKALSQKF